MATFNFSSLIGQTITNFAVAADTLAILNTGSEVSLTDTTAGLRVTTAAGSVTLAGVTQAAVTSANITVNGGSVLVGDNTTNTIFDIAGNTIGIAGGGANAVVTSNLVYGLGGGDSINVGDGTNLIFGGTGVTDTTDGGDSINLGSGTNTVYANAGDDTVNFTNNATTGIAAAKTSTIFLGLGNDTVATPGASTTTSGLVIYGGAGNDSFAGAAFTGDVTLFGGNGATDSTDGADTVQFGTGGVLATLNAGNDVITGGATAGGKTASVNLGLGDDSFTTNTANTIGNHTITGAAGADTISLHASVASVYDVTVFGGTGVTDTTDGADTITLGQTGAGAAGFGGNSTIYGNAGNDIISVAAAVTKTANVFAGLGNDTVNLFNKAAVGTTVGSYLLTLGSGNDTVNSNFTGAVSDVVITDFEASDVINATLSAGASTGLSITGNGSAIVIFNDVSAANGVYNAGTEERITITSTANLTATNFNLSDGSKVLTNFGATGATLTSTAAVDHIVSGSAADTFVGSAGNNDKFDGNGGNDVFQYTTALINGLAAGSTINGGDGTDSIVQTDAGNITLNIATALSNVTNVEQITLASGTHAITTGAVAAGGRPLIINADANAGTNTLTVNAAAQTVGITVDADGATSTGVQTITLAAGNNVVLTAGAADVITLGTGNDSVVAGAGDDTFNVAVANLTSSDTLAGGVGTNDRIVFSDVTTTLNVDSDFTNVTGVEQLALFTGAGAQTITLGTLASAAGINNVNGSGASGVVTVDAASMTTAVSITGGTAADSLTGGTAADVIYGGLGNTVDTLVGGAGADNYAFTANGTNNAIDIITSANFVAGSGGDVFNFRINASTFTNLVVEGVVTAATVATPTASLATNAGALIYTADAVGNAAALKTALDAGDLDTATFGSRIVVWEIDATQVGVAVVTNNDNGATTNDTVITQVAAITGFASQAAIDTFTTSLTAANFDFIV